MVLNKMKCYLSICLLSLLHLSNIAIAESTSSTSELIVIGDVHGDYLELTGLLESLEVIDDKLNWQAGSKQLVSLGDLVSHGKDSLKVIEFMMLLKQQALAAGGNVHIVLGDHEVMLMTGDFRHVSKREFAVYETKESKKEREKLFKQFRNINTEVSKDVFEQIFPIGFIGLFKAYQADGKIGKWLRKNGTVVLNINKTLFVHGGISGKTLSLSLQEINTKFADKLSAHDAVLQPLTKNDLLPFALEMYRGVNIISNANLAFQNSILYHPSSPFWYKGNAYCPELSESYILEDAISAYGVERIIIGHSLKHKQAISRVSGKLIVAVTGLAPEYGGGKSSAIIIKNDKINAYAFNPSMEIEIHKETPQFRGNPKGMSDNDVEVFLASAKVIDKKRLSVGITKSHKITLHKDGITLHALFKTYKNSSLDSYKHEVAAYKLDRLLGQYLVPPAILRKIDNKSGMVQLWIEDVITENGRIDNKIEYSSICEMKGNLRLRIVFDTLIMNVDRNNGNFLWDKEFYITFIDHSNAFGFGKRYPKLYRGSKVHLSKYYLAILENLNIETLSEIFSGLLSARQVRAIIIRRDFLIKEHHKHMNTP